MSKPRKLPKGSEKTIVFNFFNFFNFLNFFNFPFLRKLSYFIFFLNGIIAGIMAYYWHVVAIFLNSPPSITTSPLFFQL